MSDSPLSHAAPRSIRQSILAMLGVCLVIIMVALDQTVVGTALPTVVAELKGFDLYAWVGTAYLLASVITVPIFGRLGDYYGRKFFVAAAVLVFTLASALCGMAGSMLQLVLARALQGIGGGMLVGCAFALIPDLFPDPHQRMRWQVMFSASFGIANAIGPSLGGFLTQYYGWRSVFYVNLPVGATCLWFILRHTPHIRHQQDAPARIDWSGALLIAAALGTLQLAVELLPGRGLTPGMILLLIAGALAFIGLWIREKHAAQPILPLEMFKEPALAVLLSLSLLSGFIMFALLFYTPLLLQGGFGMSPNEAGLVITPLVVSITVGSIVNGRIVTRIPHPTRMLYTGYLLLLICCIGIATLRADTSGRITLLYMIAGGIGLGFIIPNLTVFVQEASGRANLGIATALVQSMRMIGGMLGTALVGAAVNHLYAANLQALVKARHVETLFNILKAPQLLVNTEAQSHFVTQVHTLGLDGESLIHAARQAMVAALHSGQMLAVVVTLLALWRLRRLPPISFATRAKSTKKAEVIHVD